MKFSTDNRGASITLEYVLALGLMAILFSLLITQASALVSQQSSNVVENEMTTFGQNFASNYEKADKIVYEKGDIPVEIAVTPELQDARNYPYVLSIQPHPQENVYTVKLEHVSNSSQVVRTNMYVYNTDVEVNTDKYSIGNLEVYYDRPDDTLRLRKKDTS